MAPSSSASRLSTSPGGTQSSGMAETEGGPSSTSNLTKSIPITVDTLMRDTTANLKQSIMDLAVKVVVVEERSTFIGDLIKLKRGTKEVENFVRTQESIRHEPKEFLSREAVEEMMLREREVIMNTMTNKLSDNIAKGIRKGRELAKLKSRLFWGMKREDERRKFKNLLNDTLCRKRKEVRREHDKQVRAIKINYKKEDRMRIPQELRRYKDVAVFKKDAGATFRPGTTVGPVTVGLEDGLLSEDEVAALCRGPKFCVRRVLDEETFMMNCEKSYFKLRLDMQDEDDPEDDPGGGPQSEEDRLEEERVRKAAEMAVMEGKTVFNQEDMTLDYGRKRATDCKHNTFVKLPKPKNVKLEQEIEYRRMSWKRIFQEFRNQYTDEEGVQESNLTPAEAKGLKSLKKRVKEGQIVVVKTDKSGRFSVMSMQEYERAGLVHTAKDTEVTMGFLVKNQRRLNGHMSMLLKTFLVGQNHDHFERIRNLKLTHSLSIAPLYLLFKDH